MITIDNNEVEVKDIIMLDLKDNLVFIRMIGDLYKKFKNISIKDSNYLRFAVHIKDDFKVGDIKQALVSSIKDEEDPEDRVLRCEWWPDYKELDRLAELRKTTREKEVYVDELTKDIELCNILDLNPSILKEELKNKLVGTFGGF